MLSFYPEIAAQACERIVTAIVRAGAGDHRVKAVIDPYNPQGSTRHVSFSTTKDVRETDPRRCHINYVVSDSDWEAEFARCAENHDRVIAYVKNQGLGFTVPYQAVEKVLIAATIATEGGIRNLTLCAEQIYSKTRCSAR